MNDFDFRQSTSRRLPKKKTEKGTKKSSFPQILIVSAH
jgi:hypothetical protein